MRHLSDEIGGEKGAIVPLIIRFSVWSSYKTHVQVFLHHSKFAFFFHPSLRTFADEALTRVLLIAGMGIPVITSN